MASVQSVVMDRIDLVVDAAADLVLKEIASKTADVGLEAFLKFASGVSMLLQLVPVGTDASAT